MILYSSPIFYSVGCDYHAIQFDVEGDVLKEWVIKPLNSGSTSVNPPFIFSVTRSERDGAVYCGCGDGTIRILEDTGDRCIASPHSYSISQVGICNCLDIRLHHYGEAVRIFC